MEQTFCSQEKWNSIWVERLAILGGGRAGEAPQGLKRPFRI
jgi:hypothetical protein